MVTEIQVIEVIILAGGFGTRLRGVVSDLPKPMAPVNGKPFLSYILNELSKQGVGRVILSVGYMAEKIVSFFGVSYLGMELVYVIEDQPLGTGGALKLAMQKCTQDHVYVFNGDTYLEIDIRALEELWKIKRELIIVGVEIDEIGRFGCLEIENGYVVGFSEKSADGRGIINAGCYLLTPRLFNEGNYDSPFSLERDFFNSIENKKMFKVFITNGYFNDMGTPEGYKEMQQKMLDYE